MRPEEHCDHVEEYLDDALSPSDREAMAAHVRVCPACREAVAEYRRLRRLALAVEPVPIPDDLGYRLRRRIEEVARRPERRPRILHPYAFAGAAAAAVLLLAATAVFFRERPSAPVRETARAPAAIAPLMEVLSDWLTMALNAAPGDEGRLAEEARALHLLDRVRTALGNARGEDERFLTAMGDLLVQLENGPGSLAEEARLVAMVRRP